MYLAPSDYEFQARQDVLEIIADGSETRLEKAEVASVNIMKSYLRGRYDVDLIFFPVKKFDPAIAFLEGELAYYSPEPPVDEEPEPDKVYEALQDTVGNLPTDPLFWTISYKRNPMIVMYICDIALYHFYSADATRMMPENIVHRYKDAMAWLKAVANKELDADLPQLPVDSLDIKTDFRTCSNPRENHRW